MPRQVGFDRFFGYLNQVHAHNYYPEHLWENEQEFFLRDNWFGRRKTYAPDLFTERAARFLKEKRDKPFFLYFTPTLPHADNELGAYTGNGMETPTDEPYSGRRRPQVEKNFAAMVSRLDTDVGRVLAALRESGKEQETLVIFTSDNGPHREGGHDPDFFHSRGPLRRIKRDLYEGGIRVPFIARWPRVTKAGSTSEEVVAFWDVLPTACELAGVRTPDGLDGVPVSAALSGERLRTRPPLYWEFHENRFSQAVRRGTGRPCGRTRADPRSCTA
jgi:arylsulfatase A-like enzyme